ncbi:hypothetical protein FOQG_14642 [Fusarium oxysporum f. sp. raphani 54005]|uniref:Uncharacterized protein n=1 Tax=Fusarium oxysporum f. sp. raphani 54005 TaxID=1089458 RepID=X0BFF1_FUSOX|nr:hypothetical protein FOQG_14642 [Fusarium oxysporum f. sp. raphani 54005]
MFLDNLQVWAEKPRLFWDQEKFTLGQDLGSYIAILEHAQAANQVRLRFTKREFFRCRWTWGKKEKEKFLQRVRKGAPITDEQCRQWLLEGSIYEDLTKMFGDAALFPLKMIFNKNTGKEAFSNIISHLDVESVKEAIAKYSEAAKKITVYIRKELATSNICKPGALLLQTDHSVSHEHSEPVRKKRKRRPPARRSPNAVEPEPAGVTSPPTVPDNAGPGSQRSQNMVQQQDCESQQDPTKVRPSLHQVVPASGTTATQIHVIGTPRSQSTSTGSPPAVSGTGRGEVAPIPLLYSPRGLQIGTSADFRPVLGTCQESPELQDRVPSSHASVCLYSLQDPQSQHPPMESMEPSNEVNAARNDSTQEPQEGILQSFCPPHSTSKQPQLQLHQLTQCKGPSCSETAAQTGHQVLVNHDKNSPNGPQTSVLAYADAPLETRLVDANSQTADLPPVDSQAHARYVGSIEQSEDQASTAMPDYRADAEERSEQPGSSGQPNHKQGTQFGLPSFLQPNYGEQEHLSLHIHEEYCQQAGPPYSTFAITNEDDWNMYETLSFPEADDFNFNFGF